MPEPWLAMAAVSAAYLGMFGVGEAAKRLAGVRADLTRRFSHVGAGVIALVLPLVFASAEPVIALAVSFLLFLVVTQRTGWLGSIHAIDRRSAGAFLYPIAVAAAFVLAHDEYPVYATAVLTLGVGDAVGGVVGGAKGTHPYMAWGQPKTWEGSLGVLAAVVLVSFGVGLLGGKAPVEALLASLYVGAVITCVEGALPWGLDNLGIPIAAIVALDVAGSGMPASAVLLASVALFVAATSIRRGLGSSALRLPDSEPAAREG